MILARLTSSMKIKFDDEVQALLLLLFLPDSWSRTVTDVYFEINYGRLIYLHINKNKKAQVF